MLCRRQVTRCLEEQWCLPPETPPLPLLILGFSSATCSSFWYLSFHLPLQFDQDRSAKPSVPAGIARNGYLQDCQFSIDLYIWKPKCESVLDSALPWSWKTGDVDTLTSRGWCPSDSKVPILHRKAKSEFTPPLSPLSLTSERETTRCL